MFGLSIIIPCYKRIAQTKKCLKCLSQSKGLAKEFEAEIIMVDNSPKPELKKIAKPFQNITIRYFFAGKNLGIAKAKNFGAKKAKYGILCFCDSDVEVKSDSLSQVWAIFKNNPYAALVSGKIFWKGTKKLDRPAPTDRFFKYKGYLFAECFYGRFMACYKKAFFDVFGFDDQLFNMRGEGVDLSTKFWRAGYPLIFNPKIVVEHVEKAPFSVSRQIPQRHLLMFQSMQLHAYKYQAHLKDCPYQAQSLDVWGRKLFGKNLPYLILDSLAQSIDWIGTNYKMIKEARKKIPYTFDFKPQEVFSEKKLLLKCLSQAPRRLAKFRRN